MEFIQDAAPAAFVAVGTTLTGGVLWVVRGVLTNREEIALLKAELAGQSVIRELDRQNIEDLKRIISDHRKESVASSMAIRERLDRVLESKV
ncbi:hypothetical protein [Roseovarius sp. C03]|uniref:hypothetical protein n=1 Tax=Roseovarius sp. C03 TaxID=3449222 RepID=UPI003EDC05A4